MKKRRRGYVAPAALDGPPVRMEQATAGWGYFWGVIFETSATILSMSASFSSPFLKA